MKVSPLSCKKKLNLRLDSAIFCLVTTSHEGGMATRSAPVWFVRRALALKFGIFFFLSVCKFSLVLFLKEVIFCIFCCQFFPCIILKEIMICLLSREQEVSMLTALAFTPRSLNIEQGRTGCHIEMSLQGRGSSKTNIDMSHSHLERARHVDWFCVC